MFSDYDYPSNAGPPAHLSSNAQSGGGQMDALDKFKKEAMMAKGGGGI